MFSEVKKSVLLKDGGVYLVAGGEIAGEFVGGASCVKVVTRETTRVEVDRWSSSE